jgi:AbrB family looped-hinge helix DNA binding protein
MQTPEQVSSNNAKRVGEYIGTVNTQGRVTLPEEVRRSLQVHPQDKVVFRVTEDTIEIVGKLPTLEELAGSVRPLQPTKELEVVIHEAKAEHYAKRLTHKLSQ